MIADFAAGFIGIPYADKGRSRDGVDCWGLAWLVYRDVYGLDLPDYINTYTTATDHASVTAAITDGLKTGWERVQAPRVGSLVVLKIAARPWHCGVYVGDGRFLHVMPSGRAQQLSCVERLDSPRWSRRLDSLWHPSCMMDGGAV